MCTVNSLAQPLPSPSCSNGKIYRWIFCILKLSGLVIFEDFTCLTRKPSTINTCWCPFASFKKCIWICHLKMHVHQIPYTSYFDLCTLVFSLVASLMMAEIVQQHTTWMDLLISKSLLQIPYTSSFDLCTLVLSLVASLMMAESSNSTQHKWICSPTNPCCKYPT